MKVHGDQARYAENDAAIESVVTHAVWRFYL